MVQYFPVITGSLTVQGNVLITGSINTTAGITGSFSGIATSASFASTASYVLQAVSSSFATTATTATTASSVSNLNQSVQVTGSLTVSSAITAQTLNVQQVTSSIVYSSGSNIFGNSQSNTQQFTGSVLITGSVGIGVAPSSWSGFSALQVSSLGLWSTTANNSHFSSNLYYDGTDRRYITSDYATEYSQQTGTHKWYIAGSGTAGATVSSTQAMTLNTTGDLLINDVPANDYAKLQVNATSGTAFAMTNTSAAAADSGNIMYFWGTTGYNSMASIGSFWNAAANTDAYLQFKTRGSGVNTERMRITSAGNVAIGSTNASERLNLGNGGAIGFQNTSNVQKWHIQYNAGSDGLNFVESAVADFRMFIKAGGYVGIGTNNPTSPLDAYGTTGYSSQWRYVITAKSPDYPTIRMLATNSGKVSLIGNNNDGAMYFFVNGDATTTNGDVAMILSSNRQIVFNSAVYNNSTGGAARTLYIANDYYIGGISSIRASKKNIENVPNVDWLYQLNPVTFNYRKKDEEGNYTEEAHNEINYGLIAEDTAPIADFLINYNDKEDGSKEMVGIEYMRLITPMLKAIQELSAKVDQQQAEIEALKNK